ncbi:33.9 kDa [Spodoptera frugiperda ascovirus 1a]|uniref:33.9 kDa n=1 Tax=Spodoptera frugiperda ascovirus 1a TaxID=113370 RepID=Q0E548_SFAVA|nr:33.9 kDa [Spodoptera frugiperda ascovirus 1a]CAL44653.1 33.9 kDa [Spodoptera frugiperda ascovirus 1a]
MTREHLPNTLVLVLLVHLQLHSTHAVDGRGDASSHRYAFDDTDRFVFGALRTPSAVNETHFEVIRYVAFHRVDRVYGVTLVVTLVHNIDQELLPSHLEQIQTHRTGKVDALLRILFARFLLSHAHLHGHVFRQHTTEIVGASVVVRTDTDVHEHGVVTFRYAVTYRPVNRHHDIVTIHFLLDQSFHNGFQSGVQCSRGALSRTTTGTFRSEHGTLYDGHDGGTFVARPHTFSNRVGQFRIALQIFRCILQLVHRGEHTIFSTHVLMKPVQRSTQQTFKHIAHQIQSRLRSFCTTTTV